jgi:hypothetical protein
VPNDAKDGDPCDDAKGPYCEAGHTCSTVTQRCEKWCCDGSACADRMCIPMLQFGTLGTCRGVPGCLGPGLVASCNPVTNEPCPSGYACDLSVSSFQCFPPPNSAGPNEPCNTTLGPYCTGGFKCSPLTHVCEQWCCRDEDCLAGSCEAVPTFGGTLGTCK